MDIKYTNHNNNKKNNTTETKDGFSFLKKKA